MYVLEGFGEPENQYLASETSCLTRLTIQSPPSDDVSLMMTVL